MGVPVVRPPRREYDATKRKLAYLAEHPGESIALDAVRVAPLWRCRDAAGEEKAAAMELGTLMDRLEREAK
jgi:hypothetical protein